jgi:uroporphyrinogen-III synthase
MRVIVTRPLAQAQVWAQQLVLHGIDAVALPLIQIQMPSDPVGVLEAWAGLTEYSLVVFVSPNAVECFWQPCPNGGHAWASHVLIGSLGPGTTQALRDRGLSAHSIIEPDPSAKQFDSEALWAQLARHDWHGLSVLLVRGDGGREWLAQTLTAHGAVVETVCAYQRVLPRFTSQESALMEQALAEPASHLWFFSSSQSLQHLQQRWPDADWRHAQALVTHPAIAQQAHDLGWQHVHLSRPLLPEVVACIQSISL